MSPLEYAPELFANGQFSAMVKFNDGSTHACPIKNVGGNNITVSYRGVVRGNEIEDPFPYTVEKLIARPIIDISDEEFLELLPNWEGANLEAIRNMISGKTETESLSLAIALKFTSIGVYPFDQRHFEQGIVKRA